MRVFECHRDLSQESYPQQWFYRRRTLLGERFDSVVRIRRHDAIKHGAGEQLPERMDGTGNLDMKRDLVSQAVYPAGRDKQLRFKIIRFFDRKEWAKLGLTLALSGGVRAVVASEEYLLR